MPRYFEAIVFLWVQARACEPRGQHLSFTPESPPKLLRCSDFPTRASSLKTRECHVRHVSPVLARRPGAAVFLLPACAECGDCQLQGLVIATQLVAGDLV